MNKIKPFNDNIIFMDAEFSSIDPNTGEIISMGMIKPKGEELYLEIEYNPDSLDKWVKKNVAPSLSGKTVNKSQAKKLIENFIGDNEPYIITYIGQFDTVFYWKLFGIPKDKPTYRYWFPIDFASLLFFYNINPKNYLTKQESLGNISASGAKKHNALYDARLLREAYYQLINRPNN